MKKLLLALLFMFSLRGSGIAQEIADTSSVTVHRATRDMEQEVLSDGSLVYGKENQYKANVFEQFIRWLDDKFSEWFGSKNVGNAQRALQYMLMIGAIYMVYRIIKRSGISAIVTSTPRQAVFSFTDLGENIDSIDFEERIRKAVKTGDYRLAVRWSYLRTLAELDRKQLISFAPYKTNLDYQNELGAKTLRATFTQVSRVYDYVWYGEFNTTESDYQRHESLFRQFNSELSV